MIRRKDQKKSHQDSQAETSAGQPLQEKQELLDKLQRTQAEYANYQKRVSRDTEDLRRWTKAEIIKGFLPVLDDLEQALEAGKNAKDIDSLLEGFELVHKHMQDMLTRQQVEIIPTEKRAFDPAVHEAVLQQESADHEPGTVMTELRKGYILNGRTLRPARVTVSKEPSDPEPEPEPKNQDPSSDHQDIQEPTD